MTQSNHTPTPYHTSSHTDTLTKIAHKNNVVAIAHRPEDAEFIVRASNVHDDLVAALDFTRGVLDNILYKRSVTALEVTDSIASADEALAKAKVTNDPS